MLTFQVEIQNGETKQARLLTVGEHILQGGRVCIVDDCEFVPDTQDVNMTLRSIFATRRVLIQNVVVHKNFEVQLLNVVPASKEVVANGQS